MKLIQVASLVFLLLFPILEETKAMSKGNVGQNWFLTIARALGVKLIKNSHYCRCKCRNVPAGKTCPDIVFGVGLSRQQCQANAQWNANQISPGCGAYVGHCQIYKFPGKGK